MQLIPQHQLKASKSSIFGIPILPNEASRGFEGLFQKLKFCFNRVVAVEKSNNTSFTRFRKLHRQILLVFFFVNFYLQYLPDKQRDLGRILFDFTAFFISSRRAFCSDVVLQIKRTSTCFLSVSPVFFLLLPQNWPERHFELQNI